MAITLGNLGNTLGDLGDHSRAKEMLERSLRIQVAKTLANLGGAYQSLGDDSRVKEMMERALKILEQHYGLEHPDLA